MTVENAYLIIEDLYKRVQANKTGVIEMLRSNGIACKDDNVLPSDLVSLRDMNEDAYLDLIRFLYPDEPRYANVDPPAIASTPDSTPASTPAAQNPYQWTAQQQADIIGDSIKIIGPLAGQILSWLNINGSTEQYAKADAYKFGIASERESRTMWIILGIAIVAVAIVVCVLVMNKRH